MKASDKIYVEIRHPISIEYTEMIGFDTPEKNTIEYIRKDALLEWLRKEYETISWYYEKMQHVTGCVGDASSSGKAEAYKKVIEKIESL